MQYQSRKLFDGGLVWIAPSWTGFILRGIITGLIGKSVQNLMSELKLDDRVEITRDGAKAHRTKVGIKGIGTGIAIGAVALPAALPGSILAGIGVVSAGTGIGISAGTVAAVGGTAGAGVGTTLKNLIHCPEAGDKGIIVEMRRRSLGRQGFDYKVRWESSNSEAASKTSWHPANQLKKIY